MVPIYLETGYGTSKIKKRLDRPFASISWRQLFLKAILWHLPFLRYVHCLLLLNLNLSATIAGVLPM